MKTRFAIFCLVLVCPLAAFAQPLSDRVSADALIYIGWQGSESMPAGYSQSHAKALLDQSNIPKVFNEMVPQLIRRLGQQNPQAGDAAKIVSGIAAPLWRHPTAIFASLNRLQRPAPRLAIICDAATRPTPWSSSWPSWPRSCRRRFPSVAPSRMARWSA
jgi:hypothetical protein